MHRAARGRLTRAQRSGRRCSILFCAAVALIWLAAPAQSSSAGTRRALQVGPCPAPGHLAPSVSWPAASWRTCMSGTITQSSPAVANWRGITLVVVGDEDGEVHVLNGATGQELAGWPQAMQAPTGLHAAIESSPSIAFFNGKKGAPTILVSSGSTWVSNSVGEVEAFSITGHKKWVFGVNKVAGTAVGVVSSPVVANVTGTGMNVVFGSWDHHIYVLNRAGMQVGFAYDNADTIWSTPALFRQRGQRVDDVLLGSDASGRVYVDRSGTHQCRGGFLADYRWSTRAKDPDTLKLGPGLSRQWFVCLSQSIWSSPAVGVVNASGRPAVFVGTSFFEQPFPRETDKIFGFYADNGQPIPGWPVSTSGPSIGSPAIGVIQSGGAPAIVDSTFLCSGSTRESCLTTNHSDVRAWSASGKLLWSTELLGPSDFSSPVLVPLGDHAYNDVLIGSPNGLYPLSGSTGNYLYGTNGTNQFAAINPGCRVFSTAAVIDVPGDAPGSGWHAFESCGGPPAFNTPGQIAAYPLPVAPSIAPAWPMFHENASHLGAAAHLTATP